ncbi:MAG: hypothetical protein QOJ50_200 [Cryptosporangiaceae bacterium]|nr:hypothetical protein [Cryptosporangiaceae bacterium]
MTRPQTLADRREYLEAGLRDLACGGCDAHVLVKKSSPHQTSVQWTGRAVRQCAEFAARVALGEATPLVDTCTTLRDTIEQAAHDGRLPVHEPAHEPPPGEP